jgi:ribose/xylose/arabinose/galactoside ABC-type transport system permease subunit
LFILIGVVIFLDLSSGGKFLASASITNILRVSAGPLIIAVPATMLMISGNIDLSVGSICSMTAVIYAQFLKAETPLYLAMAFVVLIAVGAGWFNGFLVAKLRITSVIATLATMSLFWGVAKVLVPQGNIMIKCDVPSEIMMDFAKGNVFLNIPPSMMLCIIVIVVFVVLERKSILGKYAIAVGGNQTAAQLAGINARFITWLLYILTGAMAGFAGITRASYMNAGDMNVGSGLQVIVIIVILLGGTSFSGGKGSILKTVTAVFIMMSLDKGLTLMKVDSYWAMLVNGIVFITALVIDNAITLNEAGRRQKMGIERSLSRIKQTTSD